MSTLTVVRIAHSSILLDVDGFTLLTDPWFSERPGYYHNEPYGIALPDLPVLDGVIVSHDHYDHNDMDSFAHYPDKRVPFAVKRGAAQKTLDAGFHTVHEIDPWESTQLGHFTVTATPAQHSVPENTYIVQAGGFTVYFGADTVLIPQLAEIPQRFPSIDIALLPINGLMIRPLLNRQVVMNPKDAAELTALLHPRVVIPIHYRYTAGFLRDHLLLKYHNAPQALPQEFRHMVATYAPEATVQVLEPGETFRVTQ